MDSSSPKSVTTSASMDIMKSSLGEDASYTIDVARFIDEHPLGAFQKRIYATCILLTLLDGFDLLTMALAAPLLTEQWHVSARSLGSVFAAGPFGMATGAIFLGGLADKIGRKRLIVASTLLMGVFSLMTVFAQSTGGLATLRFLTGLGLGGILPNLIALSTEYAPSRMRGFLTTLSFCGLSFGSMIGGLLGAWLLPLFGWRAIFIVGGSAPLLVAAWLPWGLPESIRFLAAHGGREDDIAAILKKIAPAVQIPPGTTFTVPDASRKKVSLARLFGPGRTLATLLLTFIVVLNSFALYFMLNWLPTLMKVGGLSTRGALLCSVLLNGAGGVGAIVIGKFMDRFGSVRVMALTCLIASVGVAGVGFSTRSAASLVPILILSGATILCTMLGMYVVIAGIYPTTIRSTGAGFTLGIGRAGSILGPMAGGWALALKWSVPAIFLMAAAPLLLAAIILANMKFVPRRFE